MRFGIVLALTLAVTLPAQAQTGVYGKSQAGIGTSGPLSALDVVGGAAIGAGYAGVTAAPTNGAIIQGAVGIGTTALSSTLDVAGNYTSGNGPFMTLEQYAGNNAQTFGPGIILNNHVAGSYPFIIEEDQSTASSFNISELSSPYTRYLTITQSGNVGIGTTGPLSSLDVQNGGFISARNSSNNAMLSLTAADGSGYALIQSVNYANSTPQNLVLQRYGGNVGIGVTNPSVALQVNGNIIATLGANPAGNTMCYATNTNVFGYCSSDRRLKENVAPVAHGMLDAVMQLRPVTFNWKNKQKTPYAGFIAQDVQEAIPLAVRKNPDGYYGLDGTAIESYLTGAIQELKIRNDRQAAIIADLTSRMETLEAGRR